MDANYKKALQRIEANCKSLSVSIFRIPSVKKMSLRGSERKSSTEVSDVSARTRNSVRKMETPELPKPKRSRKKVMEKVTSDEEANVLNNKDDGSAEEQSDAVSLKIENNREAKATDIPVVKTSVTDLAEESHASNQEVSCELSKKNMETPKEDLACDDKPADTKLSACYSKTFDQGNVCVAIPLENLRHMEKNSGVAPVYSLCFPVQLMTIPPPTAHNTLSNAVMKIGSDKQTKEVSVPSVLSKSKTSDSDNGERNNSSACDVLENDLPDKKVVLTDNEITENDIIYDKTVMKSSAGNQLPAEITNKISVGCHKLPPVQQTCFGSPSRVSQKKIEIELPNILDVPESTVLKSFMAMATAFNCKMKVVCTQESTTFSQVANFNSISVGRRAGHVQTQQASKSFQNQSAAYLYSRSRQMLHTGKTITCSKTGKPPLFDGERDWQSLKKRLESNGSQILRFSDDQHQLQSQSTEIDQRAGTSSGENLETHKEEGKSPSCTSLKTKNANAKKNNLDMEKFTSLLYPKVILSCQTE